MSETRHRFVQWHEMFLRQDYLPVLILILSVQGTVLISQTISALIAGPILLGSIRTFESVTSVLILIAGSGAPALAARDMADHVDPEARQAALRDLMLMPLIGALLIGALAGLAMVVGWSWIQPLRSILPIATALILAVNLTRLMAGVAQGLLIARRVCLYVIAGSVVCVTIHVVGAWRGSIDSWVDARLIGELFLLAMILFAMRGYLPTVRGWRRRLELTHFFHSMTRAMILNVGLIVRMVADATPILLMGLIVHYELTGSALNAARRDIGFFGLANLTLTLGMLPISVLVQHSVPRLVIARREGGYIPAWRASTLRILMVAVTANAVISLGAIAVFLLFDSPAAGAMPPMAVLALALPLKALAAAYGVLYLSSARFTPPLIANLAEVLAICLVFALATNSASIWTAVAATLIGSGVGLAGLYMSDRMEPTA